MNEHDIQPLRQDAQRGDPEAMLALGQKLLTQSRHGESDNEEGEQWLKRALQAGHPLAALALGDLHSQRLLDPESLSRAAAAYEQAASYGVPQAIDRLGDCFLIGWGRPEDPAQALACYERTALLGYPVGYGHLAFCLEYGIGIEPDPTLARSAKLWQAAFAYPRGYFASARALGEGSGADPIMAYALALQAERLAYPLSHDLAQAIRQSLDPDEQKTGGELSQAIEAHHRLFEKEVAALEARRAPELDQPGFLNDLALRHWNREITHPALHLEPLPSIASRATSSRTLDRASDSAPDAVERSTRPHVWTYSGFLDLETLAHVMELVWHELGPTERKIADPLSGEHLAFDGEVATLLFPHADVVIHWIATRTARVLAVPRATIEPFSVLRYRTGHRYSEHVDYLDATRLGEYERMGDRGGQRKTTFLIYLRAPERGGETHYLDNGIRIAGESGLAVAHDNTLPNGEPDRSTRHEGAPIEAGEKWLLRTAIREHPLYGAKAEDSR
ncbi:MAG: 2OG-Fe(II) oxygenase [Gammaproteobacteria bacterium]